MSLQLANYKDLEQIVKIEKDTNEHPWSLNNFKSSLDAGNSSIVLKKENIILGYAFFSIVATDSHLLNIAVSRNYQGKGYGKILVQHLVQLAKQEKCYKCILNCDKENVAFYTKCGFHSKSEQMAIYF